MKVAIIGDGGWGTTLAVLLHKKGHEVGLWGAFPEYTREMSKKRQNPKFFPGIKIPKGIVITSNLDKVLSGAEVVVLAVPSQFMRGVLGKLKGTDLSRAILVSATKGIENKTLMRMSELIRDVLGKVKLAVLSGPTIAYEVAHGMPTTVVIASEDEKTAKTAQDALMTERFRIYTSNDVIGVELGGALKNTIAIGAGISDGLKFGANSKAALLNRGIVEITRLGVAMGAQKETFAGLSGVGDLITTCISTHGRNRWLGEEIGRGKKLDEILRSTEMVVEGVATAKSVHALAGKHKVDMPITEQVYQVLYEGKDPLKAVTDLMLRQKKSE